MAGLSFWLFSELSPACVQMACTCEPDPPCESGWEVALLWLGGAQLVGFCWALNKVLYDHWPAYRHVSLYGNIHVAAEAKSEQNAE